MPETHGKTLFFADVIPLVPFPYGRREIFSYLSETDIPVGSLVLVPFGPRSVRGVVSASREIRSARVPARFKHVRAIVRESFVTPEQMSLVRSVSEECLTPVGRTLRHVLPATVSERAKKPSKNGKREKHPVHLSPIGRNAAVTLTKNRSPHPIFLEAPIAVAIRVITAAAKKLPDSSQALLLLPEQIAVPGAADILAEAFGADRVAILTSSIPDGAFFSAWERIRRGEARIILGTRQALFAPFRALATVAVLEEAETVGYKQWDMSPRYDARRVAETLSAIHGARLVFSGIRPSVEMAYRLKKRRAALLSARDGKADGSVRLVNMREERYRKNFSIFSAGLKDEIGSALLRGGRVVLIASRGGLDSFSVCESCRTIPRCPSCDRALRSTRDGAFRCPSCAYRTKTFPRCEKCGSLAFRNIGSGTDKIAREVKRLFPSASVFAFNESGTRKSDTERRSVADAGEADILIGTPSILNMPQLPETGLVAIMDADNFLLFPDFRADERFIGIAEKARTAASRGVVLLQTFRPERELFRSLSEDTVEALLSNVLRDREALGYPPFTRLFRVLFRDATESKIEGDAKHAFALLSEAFSGSKTVHILPPGKSLRPKTRGKYERQIVLAVREEHPFPTKARKIISTLPKSWAFDPDPLSLT